MVNAYYTFFVASGKQNNTTQKIGHICLRKHERTNGLEHWRHMRPTDNFPCFFVFVTMPIPTILSFGPSIWSQCLQFHLQLQVQKPETGDLSQSEEHNSCSSPSDPIRFEKSRAETCTLDILACLFYSTLSSVCRSLLSILLLLLLGPRLFLFWLTLGTIFPVTASFMGWVSRSFILLSTLRLRNLLSYCRWIWVFLNISNIQDSHVH